MKPVTTRSPTGRSPGSGLIDGVPVDTENVLLATEWTTGGELVRPFVSTAPIAALRVTARGEGWQGDPELALAIGGRRWGPEPVPAEGAWTWEVDLPAGAYRLVARFPNDASGPDGDRNLRNVRVDVVTSRRGSAAP